MIVDLEAGERTARLQMLEGEALMLQESIRNLKTCERKLLDELRDTIMNTAETKLRLNHVNSEIARLSNETRRT